MKYMKYYAHFMGLDDNDRNTKAFKTFLKNIDYLVYNPTY